MLRAILGRRQERKELPVSVLKEKGIGNWGPTHREESDDVSVEISVLESIGDSKVCWSEYGVLLAISGFLYAEEISLEKIRKCGSLSGECREAILDFISNLDGEFSGLLFFEETGNSVVFSNKIGLVPFYYTFEGGVAYCSSHLVEQARLLKAEGLSSSFDTGGMEAYLSQGGMFGNETLLEKVKRVLPGEAVFLDSETGSSEPAKYHGFQNECDHFESMDEAVDALDNAFEKAVVKQYSVDVRNGKRHFGGLSGGLDSRMDCIVSHESSFRRMNFTFGFPGCDDIRIAGSISRSLGQQQVVVGLGDGDFIAQCLKDTCLANGGVSLGIGSVHSYFAMKHLNFEGYGLLHSGQLGDAILGSFLSSSKHLPPKVGAKRYSRFSSPSSTEKEQGMYKKYGNEELYKLYTRGFLTANGGLSTTFPFTPSVSPFMDVEFMEIAFRCSPEWRYDKKLYYEWVKRKRPVAGRFLYQTTLARPIPHPPVVRFLQYARRGVTRKYHAYRKSPKSMNPFDFWYDNGEGLREFVEFELNRNRGLGEAALGSRWSDVEIFLSDANALEKFQIVSFLFTLEAFVEC